MDLDVKEISGACHCGTVKFRVRLAEGLRSARRCNCSICRMRGAVAVTAETGALEILQGADALTLYQFNTGTAKHYFCARCGVYTHHQRRSNPRELGVNVACLENVSPFDFGEILVNDGVHHQSDGNPLRIAGVLRYFPQS